MKRIIKKTEYLNALETIEKYILQIESKMLDMIKTKHDLTIREFKLINKNTISQKLNTILSLYMQIYDDAYINEMTKKKFLGIRNVGIKAWNDFQSILKDC